MTTEVNTSDRPPPNFWESAQLLEEVRGDHVIEVCTFKASDEKYRVLSTHRHALGRDDDDQNDLDAAKLGFNELWRFVVVNSADRPEAVWEFYKGASGDFRSKVIEVDHRSQGKGIGTEFAAAVRKFSKIEWSGSYTRDGARLKDRVEQAEDIASAKEQGSPPVG